jgi:hypothetical protein
MASSSAHFLTLLSAIIVGVGVISAGVWRVAAAVFSLSATVKLLAWRLEQVERRQMGLPPDPPLEHRRRRPTGAR